MSYEEEDTCHTRRAYLTVLAVTLQPYASNVVGDQAHVFTTVVGVCVVCTRRYTRVVKLPDLFALLGRVPKVTQLVLVALQ